MADARLNISQGKLKLDIKNIQKDFSHFQEYFDTRMDVLARLRESQTMQMPHLKITLSLLHSLVWAPGLG